MSIAAETNILSNHEIAVIPPKRLAGKRIGMVVFSPYPADPRPRRAIEALRSEGATVELICEAEGDAPKSEFLENLEVIRIPIRHIRGGAISYAYQYSTFILMSAAILAWRTLRRRYDLVYVHNMPDILVVSGLIPKLFGAKVVLDQHDPMPELMRTIFHKDDDDLSVRVLQHLERWSISRANLVITVNEACRRIFSTRSCGIEKIGVVMNSPDESIFPFRAASSHQLRAKGEPFVVMYHGSLVERNGLELAVDALERIRETVPEAELRVYGKSTPYLEQVMDKVQKLGLEKRVQFLGPRKLEQLAGDIQDCHVGVVPNQRNTFTDINTPTRIFEYLALGIPVIAPRTPGIQDYFNEDSLYFFEAGDADDLANQMLLVYQNPVRAVQTADRGQQIYEAHSWKSERRTLVDLVSNLINGDPDKR